MSAGWWERGEEMNARIESEDAGVVCTQHDWRITSYGGLCVECGATVTVDEL